MIRSTTNGVLKSYRYNLQRSNYTLNKARNTVLTGRNFNSFAEAPATAARCFQMRRSFQKVNTQYSVGESVVRKYEQAWSTLEGVGQDVKNRISDSAYADIIQSLNDPTASGRNALGQSMTALAKGIAQKMNCRYGDNFVFAGADGLNVPFSWDDKGNLCYRGVAVDAKQGTDDLAKLEYMAGETKYADIGLGMQEDENGEVISGSVFNVALQGINFLGYGVDADGDPKNVVSIISKMGQILERCDPDSGAFASEQDRKDLERLAKKFEESSSKLSDKFTELDTQAAFLKSNQKQLEGTAYTLQEQFLGIEDADPAEAISSFAWAQYCYNTALKVGNSVLSQSLMDYLNS